MDIPLVQRAYTLKLTGNDMDGWRDALWKTHEAVNRGAQRFGHWLLTMRGGISHELANRLPKKFDKVDEQTRRSVIRDRRVLLALSWLSVESKAHAPQEYVVEDPVAALRSILETRGVEPEAVPSWVDDCGDSLRAAVRDDAIWINRSAAFDYARKQICPALSRDELWDMLQPFFGGADSYLAPIAGQATQDDGSSGSERKETRADDGEKDLAQKAGQWLSSRFGSGKGADFGTMRQAYLRLAQAVAEVEAGISGEEVASKLAKKLNLESNAGPLTTLLKPISGPGYKSATRNLLKKLCGQSAVSRDDLHKLFGTCEADAESCVAKTGNKGRRPYSDYILADVESACGIRYHAPDSAQHWQYAVVLDHAARRVSIAHSWIKRAEERRREFEKDRSRLGNLSKTAPEVVSFLDNLCDDRTTDSGAADAYRIRKRAVDGWEEVVKAWGALDSALYEDRTEALSPAEQARIAKVRELQDQIEKFGDAQLFEKLADSNAVCVWKRNGEADPAILLNYVYGKLAEYNKQRFKVPAYRHPDPLLHPVFCDFGNSRWSIEYAVHRRTSKLDAEQRSLEKKVAEAEKLRDKLAKTEGPKRIEIEKKLADVQQAIATTTAEITWLKSSGGLRMELWDGSVIREFNLRWHCKRLRQHLGEAGAPGATEAPRADRLGRAAAGARPDSSVAPLALFEEKEWSGRLQAPRDQLEQIARIQRRGSIGNEERARLVEHAKANLGWLVSFSPRLKPQGPGIEYAEAHGFKFVKKNGYSLIASLWSENKKRGSLARFDLCRLQGLRILSADLGQRKAMSCAVWQVLSAEEFAAEVANPARRDTKFDVHELYAIRCAIAADGKRKTTVYRRLGADTLLDGTAHPAAWARLERQFVIKLQGENEPARAASNEELRQIERFYASIGLNYEQRTRDVSQLMFSAVRAARLGLRRHADLARIAFAMVHDEKQRPGGGFVHLSAEEFKKELTKALQRWFNLATAESWQSAEVQGLWTRLIERGLRLPELEFIGPEERKRRGVRDNALEQSAQALFENPALRTEMGEGFARLWQEAESHSTRNIRWLRRWVLPSANGPAIRHTGGLSLDRIGSVQELYRLQKAHYQRLTPQGPRLRDGRPVTPSEKFFQRAQKNLENMRENRIKQLASRIVEAALGVGRESGRAPISRRRFGREIQRPATPPADPRFLPCHAVVVENLDRYRPEQSRLRRENRGLVNWSAGQLSKYLADACSLHGLILRSVPPNYTSRQDSRTGAPGIRCVDVSVRDLVSKPFWKRAVTKARARCENGKDAPRDRFLVELMEANWNDKERLWTDQQGCRWRLRQRRPKGEPDWDALSALSKETMMHAPQPVRIPQVGGNIFIPANKTDAPAGRGLQADMNAACNIGLRALMDPDWQGRWWYVPCDSQFRPVRKSIEGSAAFAHVVALRVSSSKGKEGIANLWRDPGAEPLGQSIWTDRQEYWKRVEEKVVDCLRTQLSCENYKAAAFDEVF